MGRALYRDYRPRAFSEVVGQKAITDTLSKAVGGGHISHAYLFTGPRGVGKTSVARILAHAVNNLPYIDEATHLDIIEIDAASNRRIDEIRDIKEKVHIAPTSLKFKVYIIDEVHMLTKEAFNALLKTLEEPPAHCIFILATTEVHKLPETIISRTQRFNFKPLDTDLTTAHLKKIAKKENIDIDPDALELLALYGSGGLRDSIGMLDQLSGTGRSISKQEARNLLGLPPAETINQLVKFIESADFKNTLSLLNELRDSGVNPAMAAAQLSKTLRTMLLDSSSTVPKWVPALLKQLLNIGTAQPAYELLEISVLEVIAQNVQLDKTSKNSVVAPLVSLTDIKTSPPAPAKAMPKKTFSMDLWPQLLMRIRQRAPGLYSALRLAVPQFNSGVLIFNFQFPLHKNKVNESQHIYLIGEIIEDLSGMKVEIQCVLAKQVVIATNKRNIRTQLVPAQTDKSEELTTISNIFGSAEVLES